MYLYVCVSEKINPYSTNKNQIKLFPVAVSLCTYVVIRTGINYYFIQSAYSEKNSI